MNLDRYEKIDGWQALERLKNKERVTRKIDGMVFELERTADLVFEKETCQEEFDISDIVLNEFLESDWYIPKPFDVRQAMLERPNEWVAAFEVAENWYKVGFDTTFMQMACASISSEISVDLSEDRVFEVQISNLINCIPLEDVPEEATR